ncbi:hypothetical protein A2856_02885 [Candidatus Uhrbacteria bacterium RIFCSPHIGHO2_01_FULL_63_20]|uniref:ribose-phosphate diphosphokinase n=1 Tax=Candidatus Uhrbacteria bacterium RIFCSPHIGHO2_01_FULL_63_20 TaxID=1802385 RepID=A0A1F7TKU7_9BACT|nr:MAG: hypothetical protein A2856_02885 [Candidatus Uhrbacteria bacterium RIFCSPHIGHO2_01_FULL_63_20]
MRTLAFRRYENGELSVSGCPALSGTAALFGSFSPPDENLFKTLLAAHTLKKEGAGRVVAVVPFLAYMRQDKAKPGLSLTTAWLGELIRASGIGRIVTVDLHSRRDQDLVPVPIVSVSPASVFAKEIRARGWEDATLVAPDNGAVARCEAVARALTDARPVTRFEKARTARGVRVGAPVGAVGNRCVLVDDQLDTGSTLVAACERLRRAGAKELLICVTHGLFAGEAWKRLRGLGVREIVVTDTVATRPPAAWISQISVAPLIEKAIASIPPSRRVRVHPIS